MAVNKNSTEYVFVIPPKGVKADGVYTFAESAYVWEANGWKVERVKEADVPGKPITGPEAKNDKPAN